MDSSVPQVDSVAASGAERTGAELRASRAARIPVLYIQSAAHSGSTLLALELAKHPQVCTTGELSGTHHRARPGYQCSCGQELRQCGFWQDVSAAMAKRGFSYSATTAETDIRNAPDRRVRRLLKPLHRGTVLELVRDAGMLLYPGGRTYIRHHQRLKTALAESILECTGKPVLIDSSKSGVQLKYHLRNPRLDTKVVWLVRDGRGTASSLMRNAGLAMREAAYVWRRSNEEAAAIVRRLDRSRWMSVRYEALCTDPQGTLRQLWQFIGVAAHPPEGCAAEPAYHVLGHRMRLARTGKIELDEKWRTRLSPADLRIFETVAGPLNRRLGYR